MLHSRLLWFIAPLTFSNHFSNCPICRALCKPAVVNEESGNWQTHSQNKCVPCELDDWRMLLADWILPHVKECLRIQSRAKPSVKIVVTTHRLLFAQLHPKRVSTGYTKDTTSSNKNTCKQILVKGLTSNRAEWDSIKKIKSVNQCCMREESEWQKREQACWCVSNPGVTAWWAFLMAPGRMGRTFLSGVNKTGTQSR